MFGGTEAYLDGKANHRTECSRRFGNSQQTDIAAWLLSTLSEHAEVVSFHSLKRTHNTLSLVGFICYCVLHGACEGSL